MAMKSFNVQVSDILQLFILDDLNCTNATMNLCARNAATLV